MAIAFRCSACGQAASVPDDLLGRRAWCPSCGAVQRVVGAGATPGEPAGYDLEPIPVAPPPAIAAPPEPAPRPRRRREPDWSALFRAGAGEPSRVQGLAAGLVALSAADVFMTHALLRSGPAFFEANPVARWFFDRWNMAGMVGFKFAVVAGVIALAELIERRRPGRGKFVLLVGCLGAVYAVAVGLRLYLGLGPGPAPGGDD